MDSFISKNEKMSERMLFYLAFSAILILSFYVFIKRVMPLTPYIKDTILLCIIPCCILLVTCSCKIKKLNYLDKIVTCLILYLLFQFFRTGLEVSFAVAYSGFRVSFMYVFLYIMYRSISSIDLLRRINKAFIIILILGVFFTYLEAFLIWTNILPINILSQIGLLPGAEHMSSKFAIHAYELLRLYGFTGTVHTSGLYNAIFFLLLLFSIKIKRYEYNSDSIFFADTINQLKFKRILLLLSFISVILTYSRTAWTAMGITMFFIAVEGRKIKLREILVLLAVIACGFYLSLLFFGLNQYVSYINYLKIFFDQTIRDIKPMMDVIFFGDGYHVSQTAKGVDWYSLTRNTKIHSEMFFLDILIQTGLIGLMIYSILFFIIPINILIRKKYDCHIKAVAAPILAVGISFAHYSPLEVPAVNIVVWYCFAQLSLMIKKQSSLKSVNLPTYKAGHLSG